MYTFNYFMYGHELAVNKTINNAVHAFDLVFKTTINNKEFIVSTPYHGGQVRGDIYSIQFGINITDDDGNPNYIDEVRSANENDYKEDYQKFIELYKAELRLIEAEMEVQQMVGDEDEEVYPDTIFQDIINFLDTNEPKFYAVEASS